MKKNFHTAHGVFYNAAHGKEKARIGHWEKQGAAPTTVDRQRRKGG